MATKSKSKATSKATAAPRKREAAVKPIELTTSERVLTDALVGIQQGPTLLRRVWDIGTDADVLALADAEYLSVTKGKKAAYMARLRAK